VSAVLIAVAACSPGRPAPARVEALWYSTRGEQSTQSFVAHADQISIVAPQVFMMDSTGVIRGSVDPRVVQAAHEHHVKLLPLVMNPGFDQPLFHHVLTNASSRRNAIHNLAALCRENRFDGIQFDFENIHVSDKDAFTSFARESADSLHAVNCTLSAAVVPRLSDAPGPSAYDNWIFDYWRGAYDYKALAASLDFLSYMTYAQHTGGTTAGPVAGYTWMDACLRYVLSLGVPPEKISLGIPSYSDYWYPTYDAQTGARQRGRDLGYTEAMSILSRHGAVPVWDDKEKSPYAIFPVNGVNEAVWLEDARAFAAKLELVRTYRLRGYSVWVLGLEDPNTWAALRP
jgi:spore germination protein YaaH